VRRVEPGVVQAVGATRYPQLITIGGEAVKSTRNAFIFCTLAEYQHLP
jgi:hypothetical protein